VIDEATLSDRIRQARDRYLEALDQQQRALAELPDDLGSAERLVAVDRIFGECSRALRALAAELPVGDRPSEIEPEVWEALQEFRASVDDVRKKIPASRLPLQAEIAERLPRRN
jgi:hypothetical protein